MLDGPALYYCASSAGSLSSGFHLASALDQASMFGNLLNAQGTIENHWRKRRATKERAASRRVPSLRRRVPS